MIDAETIACWKQNYGLDKRSPGDALRWWNDMNNGNAPAGAVAALGLCLEEIENHAAFVARVRAIAESMKHTSTCPAHYCECGASKGYHGPLKPRGLILDHGFTPKQCECPRGQLLEVCNG